MSFLITALLFSTACGADPRTVEGAIAKAAQAVAAGDSERMFYALDERARNALYSIVKARARAAEAIRRSYPQDAQAEALRALGDAGDVSTPQELFARRCPAACLSGLSQQLAAPRSVREEDALAHVETVRGAQLTLYRGKDGRYGLVWNSSALERESSRAFAELDLVHQNAELYAKQSKLE